MGTPSDQEHLVPDALTVVSPPRFYGALCAVWDALQPIERRTRNGCLLLIGHWAHETGWGHGMHCFNIGNFKHIPGDGHMFCAFPHWEIVKGETIWLDRPPQNPPQDPFRAYASLEDGVKDYLLNLRGRWRGAWSFVADGNAPGFCHALKIAGYYTDKEALYTAGVQACMHAADQQIPPEAPLEPYVASALQIDVSKLIDPKPGDPDESS